MPVNSYDTPKSLRFQQLFEYHSEMRYLGVMDRNDVIGRR